MGLTICWRRAAASLLRSGLGTSSNVSFTPKLALSAAVAQQNVRDMTLSATSGSLKRLRRVPWRFQRTFQTPLRNLQPFVATIISAREEIQGGRITIDSVVFEPKNLNTLLASQSFPPSLQSESSIEAAGHQEVAALLEAALGDWVDFWFIPTPKPFVIYADHDEYTTFFANSKSNLNGVLEALLKRGFKTGDYERNL